MKYMYHQPHTRVTSLPTDYPRFIESQEAKSGSKPLGKLEGGLESVIDKPDYKHLIKGGDFNCPSIDWQNLLVISPGRAAPAA